MTPVRGDPITTTTTIPAENQKKHAPPPQQRKKKRGGTSSFFEIKYLEFFVFPNPRESLSSLHIKIFFSCLLLCCN